MSTGRMRGVTLKQAPSYIDLVQMISAAYGRAVGTPVMSAEVQQRNAQRSRNWVSALRDEFARIYEGKSMRALCKYCGDNQAEFGLNELLYDICICRTA